MASAWPASRDCPQGGEAPSSPVPVLIPTLNEADHIVEVMRSLLRDPPAQGLRFIIADGGSTDGTVAMAQSLRDEGVQVEVVDNPAKIQAAGINLVAGALDARVFVRCDAHGGYPAGFVAHLIETLAGTGADSVVVPMRSEGRACFQRAVAAVSNSAVGTGGSRHRSNPVSGWVDHGHHAAFLTERFRALGGYDETFVANEDAEYDARLRAAGGRVYMDAACEMAYYPRNTAQALARQYYRYGLGRASTALKHPGSLRLRQITVPAAIASFVAALVLAPFWPLAALWPGVYIAILGVVSFSFAAKMRSACGLLAGPAAMTMHVSWALGFLRGYATNPRRR